MVETLNHPVLRVEIVTRNTKGNFEPSMSAYLKNKFWVIQSSNAFNYKYLIFVLDLNPFKRNAFKLSITRARPSLLR